MNHKFVGTPWYANLPEDLQDYTKKNLAASQNYRFEGVYRNKILLFRSAEHDVHPLQCIQRADYGWGSITGASVDVVYTPGDHVSMMQNPNVVHIANALRLVLSDCELSRYPWQHRTDH